MACQPHLLARARSQSRVGPSLRKFLTPSTCLAMDGSRLLTFELTCPISVALAQRSAPFEAGLPLQVKMSPLDVARHEQRCSHPQLWDSAVRRPETPLCLASKRRGALHGGCTIAQRHSEHAYASHGRHRRAQAGAWFRGSGQQTGGLQRTCIASVWCMPEYIFAIHSQRPRVV